MNQIKKSFYSKFFNLEMNPFGETPDPDFYYGSPQHNRVLYDLVSGIQSGKGFTLLTGEVGTGKTLIARLLLSSVQENANTALILYPKFTEMELLQAILEEFEVPAAEIKLDTAKSYVDHLNRFLIGSLASGRRSILMIDEAQLMSQSALETIRLLTNLETKTHKLLQIVLIAQPEIHANLDRTDLRQLKQRISQHSILQALDVAETEKYIRSRIEQTGSGNFIRFEPGVAKIVHQLSNGVPRRINQICEQLMRAAEEKKIRLITSAFARDAFNIKFSLFSKDKTK